MSSSPTRANASHRLDAVVHAMDRGAVVSDCWDLFILGIFAGAVLTLAGTLLFDATVKRRRRVP